jgi:hypothetical protein
MVKKASKKAQAKQIDVKVDVFMRVLQITALILGTALLFTDIVVKDYDLPVWVVPSLYGIAAGLSPDQFVKMITEIVKIFIGKKS